MILPTICDKGFITVRRGGTLLEEDIILTVTVKFN